ncbi:MAG: hypothetical protein DHS20C20_00370 [Ardenticatenaceae bacterium]|nr:MAG: hypothetical protein DHS20C20_00370 [Ardenticatenaceae bacterium]
MTEQTPVNNTPQASSGGGNRMLIIGGLVGLGVVAILVIGAIFLIPRLFGADDNAIAGVMPPNTSMLVEVNALNLTNEDANRVAQALEDILQEGDIEFDADDPASVLEQIDDEMDEATGLTITDDILPWIGPNLGIGMLELDVEAFDNGEIPQIIFAATIRDTELADGFIEDLIDAIEDETDNKVDEVEHGGALVFEIDSDFDDERLAFGRSSDIFFFASNIDTLEEAIDAQNGENLSDIAEYKDTIADLPGNRAVTFYMSGESIDELASAAEDSNDLEGFDADLIKDLELKGIGVSGMVTPEGIRFDFVTSYNNISEEQQALLDAQSDKIETADFLPESTYLFIVGQRLDLAWETAVESMFNAGLNEDDFDEAMELFDDAFGFDPSKDLIPLLDGEYSLALIDSNDGLIADQFDTDLGVVMMVGSSNGEELTGLAEDFADGLQDQDMDVNDSENDDVIVYEIEDPGGELIGAYGVSEDYLIVSTGAETIEDLFTVESSLADSDVYKNVWDAFPRGTVPLIYVNLEELLKATENLDPDVEQVSDLNPITSFAMGTNSGDNTAQTTMIFFIAGE